MHTNGKIYDFTIFRRLVDLTRSIYYGNITIEQAKSRQNEMESSLSSLNNCNPPNKNKMKKTLDNAETFFMGRK